MRISALMTMSMLAVGPLGCVAGDGVGEGGEDGDVGEAREAQIDPGNKDWLGYDIRDTAGTLKARVIVTATSGGGFTANREYWYVSSNLSNSGTYAITGGTPQYWSSPPSGLGTLSFVTNRTPTWTSGTPSGTMLLHTNPITGERIGIDWGMTVSHGTWGGSITWWHSSAGNLFGAGSATTLASGTPASGTWYSFTTAPL